MLVNQTKIEKRFLVLLIFEILLMAIAKQPFALAEAENQTTDLPRFSVFSPTQETVYHSSNVSLNLEIYKPSSWFTDYYGTIFEIANGEVKFVQYTLDGQESENVTANDPWNRINPPHSLGFSLTLTNLAEGEHNLNVSVYGFETEWVVVHSPQIIFFVDTAPLELEVVSPKNQVFYNASEIPLTVETSEPVVGMSYKLDNEDPIAITGNTTLKGLPAGYHNVTIIANDAIGNSATSETVIFTIAETIVEPETFPTVPVAVASTAFAGLIGAGLIIHLKKHKHKAA